MITSGRIVTPVNAVRFIGLAGFCLVAGGCMVGPDYVRPETTTNDAWAEREDPRVSFEPMENIEWWSAFEDPLLDELIEEAYAQNLTIREAGVRVLQAMAQRGIAVGDLFPQTQEANGSYDRTKFSENPGQPQRYLDTWRVGFDAAWELDVWGKFRRAIESADAALDASLASYDDVMVTLIAEVAATYVDLRTSQIRLRIAVDNVRIQERSLEIAQTRFDLGQTSELDVSDAQADLNQTRSTVPVFEAAVRQASYRLDFLLGKPPGEVLARVGEAKHVPKAPEMIAIGIPADLLRRRPDIRLAERQAAALSAQIGVAEADLYPSFFLSGSLGYQSDSTGTLFDSRSWTGSWGPGFSWPILNYGRIKNNVRVQDAAFQAAAIAYQNTVLAAAQEVESGLAAFYGSYQSAEFLEQSVSAAERSLELSTIQYKEGSATFTRVLDAQGQLRSAQDFLASTRGDIAQSLIATYKALGGGWEVRDGMNIIPDETRAEMEERSDWGTMLEPDFVEGDDFGIPRHDPSNLEGTLDNGHDESPAMTEDEEAHAAAHTQ